MPLVIFHFLVFVDSYEVFSTVRNVAHLSLHAQTDDPEGSFIVSVHSSMSNLFS